jgi:hypothetical protein
MGGINHQIWSGLLLLLVIVCFGDMGALEVLNLISPAQLEVGPLDELPRWCANPALL